jgi:peroxiredoxin Q/BCP
LKKGPKGTTRGVFVVDKSGKVLAAEPGGPDATVAVVRKLVGGGADGAVTDAEAAKTADEVADTAAKVDKA